MKDQNEKNLEQVAELFVHVIDTKDSTTRIFQVDGGFVRVDFKFISNEAMDSLTGTTKPKVYRSNKKKTDSGSGDSYPGELFNGGAFNSR